MADELALTFPTPRIAPQSLRRLFHDENSADPDPFQSFAHQQPVTPDTSLVGHVEQFATAPEQEYDSDHEEMMEGTVKQRQPMARPSLGMHIQGAASSSSSHQSQNSDGPTPIALPDDDDDELELPRAPFGQQLRAKASYDSLLSNSTSKSQISIESRPKEPPRKPAGNPSEGLRGFQFPLNKAMMPARPPPMQRGMSAAPVATALAPGDSLSPTRPGLPRMQSAQPNLQTDPPGKSGPGLGMGRPQISINVPPRPQMMRTASAAVLGGRAQAQAQAQALAAVDEGPLSPSRNLGIPSRPAIGLGVGVGMSRSRSGSKTDDGGVGLRDLMRVCPPLSLSKSSSRTDVRSVPVLTRIKISPAAPGLSDLPPSPSTTTQNPMLKHLPQPSPLYQSQPLQTSLSSQSHLNLPSYQSNTNLSTGVPMAPSLSAISTFSTQAPSLGTGMNTAQASPNPDPNPDPTMDQSLGIRPLDMVIGDEEVYDELDRRIDEMRGWLEAVGVGLDDLLRLPDLRDGPNDLVA